MRRFASVFGMLVAALLALTVVPAGTADASPARTLDTGPLKVSVGNDALHLKVHSGSIAKVGNSIHFVNAKGVVKNRVPLTVKAVDGKSYPLQARVASDAKSVELKPAAYHQALTRKRPLKKPRNKDQAYQQMMDLANQNWPCAAPATIIGLIIGIFVPFWVISVPLGAGIGAYIGYDNCGRGVWGDRYRGETVRAFWRWWNM